MELLGDVLQPGVQILQEVDNIPSIEEFTSPLAGYITRRFREYDSDRQTSGIEDLILDSLKAVNMEYSQEDLNKIKAEGSSPIYIGLTAAKARALAAMIKDILLGADKPYSISPTASPELPKLIKDKVEQYFESQIIETAEDIKEANEHRRDLELSLAEEITLIAKHSFTFLENQIEDNLRKGNFYNALSEFIDDFAWSPTAILKGPIVTKKDKLTWSNGEPVVKSEYIFFNRRVNPLDFYPSPDNSSSVEKIRLSIEDIDELIGVPGYQESVLLDAIDRPSSTHILRTSVDQDVVDEERTGTDTPEDEIQGLHWYGAIPTSLLEGWGLEVEGAVAQVECILIGSTVAKVCINKDPLKRKPYYSASFQRRPGAFWGISLPQVMSPEQRMCNATVRALALNLGLSASPQCMVTVDRLADDGEIDEIYGGKIWQVKSDPAGNSGRPLDFFNVPSNATELLSIFDKFMALADETTGIPRYTYGQVQGAGGASGTVGGLAMLLENTTKTIKDAVRHIDEGVIVPRIEKEFHQVMLKESTDYTGDIDVVARGSQALANRAAEQLKQNEFIRATANPNDQKLMGDEGRATLLRSMAKSLNLPETIVPSRLELKTREANAAKSAQSRQELEMKKINIPVEVATIQMQGNAQSSQINAQIKTVANQIDSKENDQDFQIAQGELQLKGIKVQSTQEVEAAKLANKQQDKQIDYQMNKEQLQEKVDSLNKNIALSIKSGYEDKNNTV